MSSAFIHAGEKAGLPSTTCAHHRKATLEIKLKKGSSPTESFLEHQILYFTGKETRRIKFS
jgi:hypothetical protein